MLGWTCLKAEMASCWKVSWKVDPLALSVPLRLAELLDEPPAGAEEPEPLLGEELLPDEEQAPRTSAKATAEAPAAACFLYRSCIVSTLQFSFPAAVSAASDGRSSVKTVCARPVWPRWRYLRGNAEWIKGDWKVNFWCPGLRPDFFAKISFSYMTSDSQPFVPLSFNSRLPVLHINGRGQAASCRPALRSRTSEGRSCRWMRNTRRHLPAVVRAGACGPRGRPGMAPAWRRSAGRPGPPPCSPTGWPRRSCTASRAGGCPGAPRWPGGTTSA